VAADFVIDWEIQAKNQMRKIRFGILGSGYMGRTHAEAILRLPDHAALTAVAGGSRAHGLAQRYGIAEEPSAEALIRRVDVDAVIVATPHRLHVDATVLALREGKHAPLATTVEDCDRMIAAATAAGRVLATGYHQRFRPNNREARRLIQSGAIGHLETVQVSMPSLIDLDPFDELRIADQQGWRLVRKQPPVGHESADTAFGEGRMQAYRDQMMAFIGAIRGEPVTPEMTPVGTGRDGRVAVAVMRRGWHGRRERRWVDLSAPGK
jgi:predicted dehydrogenase